jgi:hypothetical protein
VEDGLVRYPIRLYASRYRGSDGRQRGNAAKNARAAQVLEGHINALLRIQQKPIQNYSYADIARDTGIDLQDVERLCYQIDGGGHGLTAIKSGLSMQQALDEFHRVGS